MDKFTKYALVTMTIIIAIMLVSTYVGVNVFGGKMGGTDSAVASGGFSLLTHYSMVDEYVVFTIGGAAGGLLVGYLLPSVFGQMSKRSEEKQDV